MQELSNRIVILIRFVTYNLTENQLVLKNMCKLLNLTFQWEYGDKNWIEYEQMCFSEHTGYEILSAPWCWKCSEKKLSWNKGF